MVNPVTTTVSINRLQIYARHGVFPQETKVGNIFEVTVLLTIDATSAIMDDSLDGTVNYADAVEIIQQTMSVPSKLLEHVAGRIIDALTTRFPNIISGEVTVAKPAPPISAQMDSVAVTLKWNNKET